MPTADVWKNIRDRGYESERTVADKRHDFQRSHLNAACARCAGRRGNPIHGS
jgi:hypothetical protein